ncbi:MAG: trypsin-like serine protease [Deltaproteobacteria bacterium]|nr:trypsin-like serine protease [Deltaproteobacteria bacterium]
MKIRSVPGASPARIVASLALALLPAIALADSAVVNRTHARITNGVLTQSRPTTGTLLVKSGINYGLTCSGTLIGCQTFLTAAHCVCAGSPFVNCGTPSPSGYAVYLQNVGIVGVSAIDVDPTYDFASQGDVAVVTLSAPITGVPPTPINTTMRPPLGTAVEIAGYGLTQGGASDTGILREGQAVTDGCQGQANDAAHVCWVFDSPLGAPGADSNTCNGDSGGPLFVDFGGGEVVAGITSGGISANCLPTDVSYDTDVYVHRAFIQSIGGADLLSTTCDAGSQVGDVDTEVSHLSFNSFTAAASICRKEVRKQYARYTTKALKLHQRCLKSADKGDIAGPCPDAQTTTRLSDLAAKVDPTKLAAKCPSSVVPVIGAALGCASAADASDLTTCLLATGDAATARMLDAQYADSTAAAPIADDAERGCQEAIAKAMGGLVKSALKAIPKCENSLDANNVASCPDASASTALAKAESKANDTIAATCSAAEIQALDAAGAFGGLCAGASSVTALQDCERDENLGAVDDVTGILDVAGMTTAFTVTVPAGASRLVLTLNGREAGANDLDLYARLGAAPTTSVFDAASENGGMFEEIEVAAPTAGLWHVLIARYSGDTTIPFQLNATVFKP